MDYNCTLSTLRKVTRRLRKNIYDYTMNDFKNKEYLDYLAQAFAINFYGYSLKNINHTMYYTENLSAIVIEKGADYEPIIISLF